LVATVVPWRIRAIPARPFAASNYAGDCRDYTTDFPSPYACKSFDLEEGIYGDCHPGVGDGHWPSLRTYREIITSYVTAE